MNSGFLGLTRISNMVIYAENWDFEDWKWDDISRHNGVEFDDNSDGRNDRSIILILRGNSCVMSPFHIYVLWKF